MVNAHFRTSVIGGSIAVLALVVALSMSMAASLATAMFLAALAVAPGIVIALLSESASPSVAEILRADHVRHASQRRFRS